MAATCTLKSVDFQVFGKVQGVFFRKHTQETAKKLGLVGWVKNTGQGTVVGTVEGETEKVAQMKKWLQETGSPKSKIEKCQFEAERNVNVKSFGSFVIRK